MVNSHFIELAHEYTNQSHHVNHVTDIQVDEANKKASFTATFKLNFPSAITGDETEFGVKREEKVKFEFCEKFPTKKPFITLRKDFPRDFEHINPNSEVVNPCIYERNLSELLQQPKFFDEILDQMAFWLDKTVTNTLFDSSQGWEPMRTDENLGFIEYPISLAEANIRIGIRYIGIEYYKDTNKIYASLMGLNISNLNKTNHSILIPFVGKGVADRYYPNNISTYRNLVHFCQKVHIPHIDEILSKEYKLLEKLSLVFVTLFIKRPVKLIGTNSEFEIINFAINVKTLNSNKIQHGAFVYTLATVESASKELLAKFSGLNKKQTNKDMTITQIGCGSLGSKIISHLAKTGITNNINLIDNGLFNAHNYARHALSSTINIFSYKSRLLESSLNAMGLLNVKSFTDDIRDTKEQIKENQILIESTADISVRNFLVDDEIKSEVI